MICYYYGSATKIINYFDTNGITKRGATHAIPPHKNPKESISGNMPIGWITEGNLFLIFWTYVFSLYTSKHAIVAVQQTGPEINPAATNKLYFPNICRWPGGNDTDFASD